MSAQAPSEDYGRLIVKPKRGVPEAARVAAERALGLTREARVLDGTVEILEVSGGADKGKAAAAALAKTGNYEYVEPDTLIPMAAAAPNDPDFGLQWGLKNAQHPGIDINALAAWDISQGAGAVIAVLDSGERHLYDLAQTRWANPGETANGLDDDGNGLVDDLYGWNYWHGTNDVSQGDPTHGTHVAGITGAITISAGVYESATTTLKFMAVDLAGNRSATRTEAYTIDATAPVLLLPADMTVEAASSAGAAVTYSASATDAVAGNVPVVCTPGSGSTFPVGVTTVTCSATDNYGNTANGSFTISVVADTTAPGEVLNLTAQAGNRSVTLTWTDPGDSDLAKILVSWWGGAQEVAPGAQTLTVTGLKNGTSYEFRVRSADIAGNVSAGTTVSAVPQGTGGSGGGCPRSRPGKSSGRHWQG